MKYLILQVTYGGFYGGMQPIHFWYCVLFAAIGAYITLQIEANSRNVHSKYSPQQFSYMVLIQQNWQRILLNIVCIYVVLRFCKEITGIELTEFKALIVGLGIDGVQLLFKKLRNRK